MVKRGYVGLVESHGKVMLRVFMAVKNLLDMKGGGPKVKEGWVCGLLTILSI
ncbi:MAG: hypothetical protein HY880_01090 [Deltaproteobacteria bacterium]|nr:hypothetical protein [Deltaproteobacteria bacterium]